MCGSCVRAPRLGSSPALLAGHSFEGDECDVVLLLPALSHEVFELVEYRVGDALASGAVLDDLFEPGITEHLAGGVVSLGHAVAV